MGSPGTGKTKTIAALIEEFILRHDRRHTIKILISAFSYAAINEVLKKIEDLKDGDSPALLINTQFKKIFLISEEHNLDHYDDVDYISRSDFKDYFEELAETRIILFSNAHQLYNLHGMIANFDLILVDEFSQFQLVIFYLFFNTFENPE